MRWYEYKMEVDDLHASDDLKAKLLAMQPAEEAPKPAMKPKKAIHFPRKTLSIAACGFLCGVGLYAAVHSPFSLLPAGGAALSSAPETASYAAAYSMDDVNSALTAPKMAVQAGGSADAMSDRDAGGTGTLSAEAAQTSTKLIYTANLTIESKDFDAARTAGEGAVVTDDPNSYVVVFHSSGREEYNSVDVRHILFRVDTSSLDSSSETYDADLQALKDAAKAKAEDALAQWQANGATEDAFAALANELSDDSGSNTNGGLYTEIVKGQMVTEFNDWCFDASRKTGDTGIVYNEGSYTGYHVMYFVGEDIPAWQVSVENVLANSDYAAWVESLVASADVKQLDGMSSVG